MYPIGLRPGPMSQKALPKRVDMTIRRPRLLIGSSTKKPERLGDRDSPRLALHSKQLAQLLSIWLPDLTYVLVVPTFSTAPRSAGLVRSSANRMKVRCTPQSASRDKTGSQGNVSLDG